MIKKEIYDFLFFNKPFEAKKENINLGIKEVLKLDFPTYLLLNDISKIKEILECDSVPILNFEQRLEILNKITSNYINGSTIENYTPFLFLVNKGGSLIEELEKFLLKITELKFLFYSNNILTLSNPAGGMFLFPENTDLNNSLFGSFFLTKEMSLKDRIMFSFKNAADSQYFKTLYLILNEDLTINREKLSVLRYFLNENNESYVEFEHRILSLEILNYQDYLKKDSVSDNKIVKIITLPYKDSYLCVNIIHSTRAIFALNNIIEDYVFKKKEDKEMKVNRFKVIKNLQMISKPQNMFFPAPAAGGFYIMKNSEIVFNKDYIKVVCLEDLLFEDLKKLFNKIMSITFFKTRKDIEKLNLIKEFIQGFRVIKSTDNFQYKRNIVKSNIKYFLNKLLKYVSIFDKDSNDFNEKETLFKNRLLKLIKEEFNIHNQELLDFVLEIIEEGLSEKLCNN